MCTQALLVRIKDGCVCLFICYAQAHGEVAVRLCQLFPYNCLRLLLYNRVSDAEMSGTLVPACSSATFVHAPLGTRLMVSEVSGKAVPSLFLFTCTRRCAFE